ncbi:MAG: ABC transporter ATP-binding protein [Thermoanaerobaculia bacterium]|nr:ABC transporter ATP-binding protein [Thermoanaerobaculia bacterium]
MSDHIIEIDQLSRRFGSKTALDDATIRVPRGLVFGLVGENGAGKTTMIKHILGLLKAEHGAVRVFGRDPVAEPVAVLARLGYLSEDRCLPQWMRVDELMRYTKAFYPGWDDDFATQLCETFELDPRQKIRSLSRGQHVRTGLLIALAHRPELLVLDEPSSGLDPVVRRDILEAIIRTVADEGRTILFSSHLLDEVERVSDRVAMLHQGRVVLEDDLEEIKNDHRRLTLRFQESPATPPDLPGQLRREGGGLEWTFLCTGIDGTQERAANEMGARFVAEQVPTLDEIFLAWRDA